MTRSIATRVLRGLRPGVPTSDVQVSQSATVVLVLIFVL